jgi:hypothetical protein
MVIQRQTGPAFNELSIARAGFPRAFVIWKTCQATHSL